MRNNSSVKVSFPSLATPSRNKLRESGGKGSFELNRMVWLSKVKSSPAAGKNQYVCTMQRDYLCTCVKVMGYESRYLSNWHNYREAITSFLVEDSMT